MRHTEHDQKTEASPYPKGSVADYEQLRQILASAADAYVAMTDDALIVDCNLASERLLGWSRDEMLGAVATELIPHTLNHESPMAPASAAGGSPRLIGTIWRRDGAALQVELVVWQTEHDGSSLWHLLCRDISGRVNRLHELAVGADRLNEAQRMAGLGSWEWDLESGHTHWSSQLYAMVGIDPRRSVSMSSLLSCLHADDFAAVSQTLETNLRDGGPHRFQARFEGTDGSQWWFECRGEVWLDADGVATRAVGTVQDITDRKEAEARRAAEQALLSMALDHSPLGCFLFRADTGIFRVNDAMGKIVGMTPEQLLGVDPRGFAYVDGADIATALTEMIDGGRSTMAVDGVLVRTNGTVVRVAAQGVTVPATAHDRGYILAQWCDVNPRRCEDGEVQGPPESAA